jgi:anti-sigma regulatory factor (Ser/Thr protein kinase)
LSARPERHARESPPTAEAVRQLRWWIENLCDASGATEVQRADVALAVSEALTNVVMHAYVGRPSGPMRIRTEHSGGHLVIEVEDLGIGLRPRLDSPGGGLGLALIGSLATDLVLRSGPGGTGTLVRMAFPIG